MKQFFIFLLSIFVVSFLGAAIKSCKSSTSDKSSVISSDTIYLKNHYAYQYKDDFVLVGVYNNGDKKEVAHKNQKQSDWAIEDTTLAIEAALHVVEETLINIERLPVYIFGNDTIHLSYGDTVRAASCMTGGFASVNPYPSPMPDSTPIKYRYVVRNNNPLPLTALIDEKNGRLPITPYPVIYSDSTPVKYRYIIRIEATPQQWGRAMYISDSIMLHWGKERGGTEIEKALNMYSAVMDFLRTAAKVDSVRIK